MPLLALDDTDTSLGGCTTHTAFCLARAIDQADGPLADWTLVAPARLVRLNPAAPHRTRGNGALVLPIGTVMDKPAAHRIGTWLGGAPIMVPASSSTSRPMHATIAGALQRLVDRVLPAPDPSGADPQPAALLLSDPPPAPLYERVVARTLAHEEALALAPATTVRLTPAGRRGEIGALAAAAWPAEQGSRWSWEYIGYREESETTPERRIPARFSAHLGTLDGGFDNHDPATGRLRAVPRTPCPVRFAVRGRDPHTLVEMLTPVAEGLGGWLLLTNQATGDHARFASTGLQPHAMTRVQVQVEGTPRRGRGGHLLIAARCGDHKVTLAAFEPTKTLRDALQEAVPGDRLEVLGRTSHGSGTVAVEAFRVQTLAPRVRPGPNPRCPDCGKATKSLGRGVGFRCPDCRARLPESVRSKIPYTCKRLHADTVYQVPDHVRGHLLPPLAGLGPSKNLAGACSASVPPVLPDLPVLPIRQGDGREQVPLAMGR